MGSEVQLPYFHPGICFGSFAGDEIWMQCIVVFFAFLGVVISWLVVFFFFLRFFAFRCSAGVFACLFDFVCFFEYTTLIYFAVLTAVASKSNRRHVASNLEGLRPFLLNLSEQNLISVL